MTAPEARGYMPAAKESNWETPLEVLELVREMGPIALDPCTTEENPCGAAAFLTPRTNGLTAHWFAAKGLVYANPPYGRALNEWAAKMALEASDDTEIIALVPARTDTQWWQRNITTARAICFWEGRIRFVGAESSAPFPSALVYWGPRDLEFATIFKRAGWVVRL